MSFQFLTRSKTLLLKHLTTQGCMRFMRTGAIADKAAHYVWPVSGSGKEDDGHIQVRWSLQDGDGDGSAGDRPSVRQYNVSWTNSVDGTTREMFLEPHITKCSIPANKRRLVIGSFLTTIVELAISLRRHFTLPIK
jgi:hypothetical protein